MSGKKWFALFLTALALAVGVWAGLNVVVDPFNAFGDRVFHWDAYTQTLNPRNSKTVYLSQHLDEYDSYVVGSSSAASYLPDTLEKYLGGSFYNMFHYGSDIEYDKALVAWLLESDDVKRIVLVRGISEANATDTPPDSLTYTGHYRVTGEPALSYYFKFLFASPSYAFEKIASRQKDTLLPQSWDVFLPKDGTYDKRVREVEPIGTTADYLALHGADFPAAGAPAELGQIDACVRGAAEIRAMCEAAGAELTVILTPVCDVQLEGYTDETLNEYFQKLAEVTDYWNFAVSPLTWDRRYFYDATHTRNELIDLALARAFGDEGAYAPDSFGILCRAGEVPTVEELREGALAARETLPTATVPVLVYHHLVEEGEESGTVLRSGHFAHQMELLEENGYRPVALKDLIAFVDRGEALPDRAVVITFDDGYLSNYELGYPVLREHGFPATIFVIGCSVGHERYYKDTRFELTPHFGQAEIDEMAASGLISIQSHTYDMHQWPPFETGERVRSNILPFDGESQEDYAAALIHDVALQNESFAALGLPASDALAFPEGRTTTLTDVVLHGCGYRITLTTDEGRVNELVPGLPQSLVDLGRLTVSGDTTDEALLAYLERGRE